MRTGSALLQEQTDQTTGIEPVGRDRRQRPPWLGRPARQPLTDVGLGWRLLALVVLAATIVLNVLHGALPVTPFSKPTDVGTDYSRVFAPQGWAFFTRSPRTPHLTVVGNQGDGRWTVLSPGRLAVPADLMGLDRIRQAQDTDIRRVLPEVPDRAWSDCQGEPLDCLSALSAGPSVANPSTRRDFCGDIGLIMQEVVPWAWRDLPTVMPSKVARVTVTC
jgi:antimicrobial peptide system SdpA family protein